MSIKKEFLVERNGRTFVLYAGLLDLAHEQGLKAITTTLVQIPSTLNDEVAIVHATVETDRGVFTGLGDAGPMNVSKMILPHSLRMAETRAKARALRDAVNVGVTALEELGPDGPTDEPVPIRNAPSGRIATPNIPTVPAEIEQDTRRMRTADRVEARTNEPRDLYEEAERRHAATQGQAQQVQVRAQGFLTEPQMRLISSLCKDLKIDMPANVNEFTVKQASDFITTLKAKQAG